LERERRFLLAALPGEVSEPRTIVDRHLAGTRLRLRQVTAGGESIYQLAEKVRPVAGDPITMKITNVYLDQAEYRPAGRPDCPGDQEDPIHAGRGGADLLGRRFPWPARGVDSRRG
jgi:hypothetical protein